MMGIFVELIDLVLHSQKYRSVVAPLSRSDYYKLQLICDALNEQLDSDYEFTPEMIATRVLETFIAESFEDSTNRIVHQVLPEARRRRTRR